MTIKQITKSLQLTFTVAAIAGMTLTPASASSGRTADIVISEINGTPLELAADRTESATIYFPYGSITSDLDIRNAIGSMTIDSASLEFDTSGFEDWFYGSPSRTDAENPPQQPTCDSSYSGTKYNINPSLATSNSLTYGLQSAFNQTSNGYGGASTVNFLREKHTGCIKAEILVTDSAQQGDVVRVIFDEDSAQSPDYQASRRPPRQVLEFTIAAPQNQGTSSRSSTSSNTTNTSSSSSTSSSTTNSSSSTNGNTSTANNNSTNTNTNSSSSAAIDNNTTRSGGPEILAISSLTAIVIVTYLAYKTRRSKITDINLS